MEKLVDRDMPDDGVTLIQLVTFGKALTTNSYVFEDEPASLKAVYFISQM